MIRCYGKLGSVPSAITIKVPLFLQVLLQKGSVFKNVLFAMLGFQSSQKNITSQSSRFRPFWSFKYCQNESKKTKKAAMGTLVLPQWLSEAWQETSIINLCVWQTCHMCCKEHRLWYVCGCKFMHICFHVSMLPCVRVWITAEGTWQHLSPVALWECFTGCCVKFSGLFVCSALVP